MKVRFVTLGKNRMLYAASVHGTLSICDLFGRIELYGEENVPNGPCLVVANHVSFLDPPAMAFFHDTLLKVVARDTLWKGWFWSRYFTALHAIPVKRDDSSNLGAFKTIFSSLKNGTSIVIFPEGTRSPDGALQPGKAGAALIALKANVPILPIRSFGFEDILPRSNVLSGGSRAALVAGKPINVKDIDPGKSHPDRAQHVADRIMEAIASISLPPLREL